MTSVGSILGGGFGLVRRHPGSVLVWGLIQVVATLLLMLALVPLFQTYGDFFSQQLAAGPNHRPTPEELQPFLIKVQSAGGLLFLGELGFFAVMIVLFSAAQRAVLRPQENALAFLRLGMDELRLVGLGIFLMMCLSIGTFVAMLGLALVVGILVAITVASGASPAFAAALFMIAYIALMGAMIYFEVRFSLAFPLTFMRRSFVVGEAWRLSKGRFWTLFGAYFVIWFICVSLFCLLAVVALTPLFTELAAPQTPEAFQLVIQRQMERFTTLDATNVALGLGMVLLSGFAIAMFGGALATAARDLALDDAGTTQAFA